MKNIAVLRWIVVCRILQGVLGVICKVDAHEYKKALEKLETGTGNSTADQRAAYSGPVILAINHINFLEVPLLASYGYPRRVTGLAKEETWKNPFMSFLFNTYGAVPLDRDGSFNETFRRVREAMEQGFFMIVAPRGAGAKTGCCKRVRAVLSNCPWPPACRCCRWFILAVKKSGKT